MTDWVLKGSIRGPAGEIPNVDQFLKIAGGALSNGDNEKIASLLIMGEGTSLSLDTSKTYSNIAVNGPSGSNKKIRLQSSSSSSTFTMDDKSIGSITDTILSGSGNALATDKAVKDYVDTSIADIDIPEALPEGGTEGQVLTKTSEGEAWSDIPDALPSGGNTGQVLTKTSDGEVWSDIPDAFPSGGTNGQVLTKTVDGEAWSDIPDAFPSGGTNGQVLTKTSEGEAWSDIPDAFPAGGNTGQVLTKTSDGEVWSDIPDALPSGGNTGQVLTKTEDGGEWADAPQPDLSSYVETSTLSAVLSNNFRGRDGIEVDSQTTGGLPTVNITNTAPMPSVVPVSRGGTGATDDATARANLGITPANIGAAAASHNHSAADVTSGTLPLARGGTGVTTEDAVTQLVFSHAPEASPTQAGVVKTLSDQDFCEYMGIEYNPEDWS